MPYAPKLVLRLPLSDEGALRPFVEACLRDRVELIAVSGVGAEQVEDLIDDLVVGDGSDSTRFICTSAHPDETLEDALEFAFSFKTGHGEEVEQVTL
jgi:hypothetical protein